MCGAPPETLTQFQIKTCTFPYPISDQEKILKKKIDAYFSPDSETASGQCKHLRRSSKFRRNEIVLFKRRIIKKVVFLYWEVLPWTASPLPSKKKKKKKIGVAT